MGGWNWIGGVLAIPSWRSGNCAGHMCAELIDSPRPLHALVLSSFHLLVFLPLQSLCPGGCRISRVLPTLPRGLFSILDAGLWLASALITECYDARFIEWEGYVEAQHEYLESLVNWRCRGASSGACPLFRPGPRHCRLYHVGSFCCRAVTTVG